MLPLARTFVLLVLVSTLGAPAHGDEPRTARVAGSDRIGTAIAAADAGGAASTALLATARDYPDALAAAALAGRADAPLLLTEPHALPPPVADALRRLGVREVIVLGGTAAVSESVEADLRRAGLTPRRVSGASRFATAAALARLAAPEGAEEVALALGEHDDTDRAWPDAVAAASLAASHAHMPLLLTRARELPPATEQALADLGAAGVLLIGGEGSVAAPVERRLEQLGYTVRRLAGPSRYDTAVAVAREAARRGVGDHAVVTSGDGFADALPAAALAARRHAPLTLVAPQTLPRPVEQFLRERAWAGATVVGGVTSVSDDVVARIDAALSSGGEVVNVYEGRGTWYGPGFEGARTACGNTFRPDEELTAAHRELDCGTRVRVTNLENGRQVTVEITDRGPWNPDLIIDVSSLAAEQLQMKDKGTVEMRLEVLAD